jgi:hypothetical protein
MGNPRHEAERVTATRVDSFMVVGVQGIYTILRQSTMRAAGSVCRNGAGRVLRQWVLPLPWTSERRPPLA